MVNAIFGTIYMTRNQSKYNIFFKTVGIPSNVIGITLCVGVCSFTYIIAMFYGEERIFYQNSIRDDVAGFYIRQRYF